MVNLKMAKSSTDTVITTVGDWYEKLPNLPKDARELLVKITPWVALIFGILGVLGGITGLGILSAVAPVAMMGQTQVLGSGMLAALLMLISAALLLAAFPGTRNRKEQGWKFLFWSEVVSVVAAVLGFSIGGVLFSLIGLYLVFQIRSYYK